MELRFFCGCDQGRIGPFVAARSPVGGFRVDGVGADLWRALMWQELLVAFGLMLILEGILPFLYPKRWQRMVEALAQMDPRSMRLAGLVSMLIGLAIVMWVR